MAAIPLCIKDAIKYQIDALTVLGICLYLFTYFFIKCFLLFGSQIIAKRTDKEHNPLIREAS